MVHRRSQLALLAALAATGCHAGAPISPELSLAAAGAAPGSDLRVLATLAQVPSGGLDPVSARRTASAAAWDQLRQWLVERSIDRSGPGGRSAPTWLWGAGAAAVTVQVARLQELAGAPGVTGLRLDAVAPAPRPFGPQAAAATVPAGTPWNLAAVGAPALWAAGLTGAGATVAILDTGVDALHPDLAPRFRGGADDWFDPYGQHAAPADPSGHGTGVAGLVLGGDASGAPLGVAPGARWIAAKVYDDAGLATLSAIHRALQWAADPDGDPATADRPDAVVLAFTFPSLVGRCWREFEPDVSLLRAAGVLVVMAAGNSGAGATEPPANNPGGFPIGAFDAGGAPTAFTSHGTSACLAGAYPALLAPGDLVRTGPAAPLALDDDFEVPATGRALAAPGVLGNDRAAAPLAATLLIPPSAGTLTLLADGSFTYRPLPLFAGEDRFVYLASNDAGSSPATVTLHVATTP